MAFHCWDCDYGPCTQHCKLTKEERAGVAKLYALQRHEREKEQESRRRRIRNRLGEIFAENRGKAYTKDHHQSVHNAELDCRAMLDAIAVVIEEETRKT